ncbi:MULTISPECIES: glycoside hydrolase family protein [unclassified Saccharicrinis]|uniref:glycoside hydrolase family protein n=1 Tax=unclassified Saccharicrinis TaxID=2646859 RepID=UPI003D3296EC
MKRRDFVIKSVGVSVVFTLLSTLCISCKEKVKDIAFVDRILPAPKNGGYQDSAYWIWGSSVIKGEDGRYHMFASRWPRNVNFGNWVTNSEVVHAVADTPIGPYETVGAVLPPRGKEYWDGMCTHNPRIVKYKDQYLLYYFGTTYDFERPTPENPKVERDNWSRAWQNKRIGVAISNSVYGPWKRLDKPVIEPREKGHWDASITSNPAPVVNEKTGEILLMYKSSADANKPPLLLGVAKASNPQGPYERLSEEPILRFKSKDNERIDLEDPYVWWNGDKYEAIIKDRTGVLCGEEGGGVHAWSDDGVKWQLFENPKAYSRSIKWDDGTTSYQNHFERPFLLIEDGVPTHFFAATGNGEKAWSFDKTWNMVIPLKTDL